MRWSRKPTGARPSWPPTVRESHRRRENPSALDCTRGLGEDSTFSYHGDKYANSFSGSALKTDHKRPGQPDCRIDSAFLAQFNEPISLHLCQGSRRISGPMKRVIKTRHDRTRFGVAHRPEGQQEVLRPGLNKSPAQPQYAL